MLVAQAWRAAELFTGTDIPESRVETVLGELTDAQRNVILIGMPGCGKTTVGEALARQLGKPLVDVDEEIVRAAGCSIPEIFAQEGEEGVPPPGEPGCPGSGEPYRLRHQYRRWGGHPSGKPVAPPAERRDLPSAAGYLTFAH